MKRIFSIILFGCVFTISSAKNQLDSLSIVTISAVGDLMCHSVQCNYAKTNNGSFDFNPIFKFITKFIQNSDLSFGNLETVISGNKEKYSGYPLFNSPVEYLQAIKNAGFDILFTSNNHCLDKGETGLINTIEKIKEIGLINVGTFVSQKDRDSIRLINLKGINIAVLGYTFSTNGIPLPKNKNFLVNIIDTNLIKSDINNAKAKKADLILVYYHFGDEYSGKPSKFQEKIVKKSIAYGASIILGSHPHVIQKVEKFKCNYGNIDTGFVAYSLGNFVSNQRWRYSDAGMILQFTIVKNFSDDSIKIVMLSYVPTWVYKGELNGKKEFVILPCDSAYYKQYDFLNYYDWHLLKQSLSDTKKALSNIRPH
ncbi:CapA family protein [Melioribacteraceae bacterium 4301-Me]|uniref:CapA family protein n=1 Tax=Pyranulibacter aquaticus TaxID=3163344 RepID=UPI003598FB5C